MSTFTPEQRAEILRQSREHLEHDDRPVPPAVLPEPPPLVFEDAQTRWNREAEAASAARAAYKIQARREEERAARTHTRAVADATSIEDRLDALERRMDDVEQAIASLANGSVDFSNAAVDRLSELETLANKLNGVLETLRATHKRECDALRDRLATNEMIHTREFALTSKQLSEAQRTIDVLTGEREQAHTRRELATLSGNVDNVVQLLREDIINRNGAA